MKLWLIDKKGIMNIEVVVNSCFLILMSILIDSPENDPSLNFNLYANQICKSLVQLSALNEGAFSIGIFGSWGTGKTTLMRKIQSNLDDSSFQHSLGFTSCKTIWFNSWKYDSKEAIWSALIQTILLEVISDSSTISFVVRNKAEGLMKTVISHAYGVSKNLVVGYLETQIKRQTNIDIEISAIETAVENVKKTDYEVLVSELNDHYNKINHFEEDFKAVVNGYIGEKGKLVIFIDDLDRCLPDNALTVLEALKLYLDKANCVFFVGLDKRTIEQAVRQRFKNTEITGREYIEKMIQLNFFIPTNSLRQVQEIFSLDSELYSAMAAEENLMWDMILNATEGNLRKIKQFIASWEIVKNIALSLGINPDRLSKLAKILIIQMNFPEFYDELSYKDYTFLQSAKKVLEADRFNKVSDVKNLLVENKNLNELLSNKKFVRFLIGYSKLPYHPDISDPDELKDILIILSQTGTL